VKKALEKDIGAKTAIGYGRTKINIANQHKTPKKT